MLSIQNKRSVAVIAGVAGTGKTTFGLRLHANRKHDAVFIFDPEGEYAHRLSLPAAENAYDLGLSLCKGVVLFDPSVLFGGDHEEGFAFFCEWTHTMCERIPGNKLLIVDEAWRYMTTRKQPVELELCVRTGRRRGLGLLFNTQTPNLLHPTIRNECTELVCFRLGDDTILEWPRSRGFDTDAIKALPDLHFIARNLDSGGELRGAIKL